MRNVLIVFVLMSGTALAQERTVADGVFSDAQASRGAAAYEQSCSNCHRADLSGNSGPALKEQRFARVYAGKELRALYSKVQTMPRNAPNSLTDEVYLDIVAHVLRENGFKAGPSELTAEVLDAVRVVPGQPKPPPPIGDYSYVEVVGCLTGGPGGTWMLTKASEPVAVAPGASTADAGAKSPGAQTFHLLDALAYAPATHRGHTIAVRGLLIRLPDEQRLTISALETVSPTCAQSDPIPRR